MEILSKIQRGHRHQKNGMIGGIIGGVTTAIGSGFAAHALNKGYKQQQAIIKQRLSDVKAHRDNLYYQDPTQSAENQAAVTQAQAVMDNATKRAQATNIVAGGTDESVALAKQQAAQQTAQLQQAAAVQGARQKEQIWNAADEQINTWDKYLADSKLAQGKGKADAITSAAGGLADAANSLPW